MKNLSVAQKLFEELVEAVFLSSPIYGYRRSGKMIKKISLSNAAIVQFQKSTDSNKDLVKFTLNLSIVNGELLKIDGLKYPYGITLKNSKAINGHLEMRIGNIIGKNDIWWIIKENINFDKLVGEIIEIVYNHAIPYLEQYLKSENLLQLWTNNGFHGLMPGTRDRYIEALSKILAQSKL